MLLSQFKEDSEKQQNGTPIYIGDATFFGRRFGTPESKKVLKELRDKLFGPLHKWTEQDDDILLGHWLTEYGIVNWLNVEFESEVSLWQKFLRFVKRDKSKKIEILPYSKKAAKEIFLDEEYFLSLNNLLIRDLNNFENFLYDAAEEDIEALKKN